MKRNIEEQTRARSWFVHVIVAWCLIAAAYDAVADELQVYVSDAAIEDHESHNDLYTAGAFRWPASVAIEQSTTRTGPLSSAELASVIEYAAWSWGERTGVAMRYDGITGSAGDSRSGRITVTWRTAEEVYQARGSRNVRAYASTWYSLETGFITGSIVYLNMDYFLYGADDCAMHTVMHEIGHALGKFSHSDNQHDLMFRSNEHCRFTPTAADVLELPYQDQYCHVELMRGNHLYVPNYNGMAAYLRYMGDYQWRVEQYEPARGSCSSVSIVGGAVELSDVRSAGGKLSLVRMVPVSDNVFRLDYAR